MIKRLRIKIQEEILMERFIAVDAGKGSTKVAYYTQNYKTAKAVFIPDESQRGGFKG